MDKSHKHTKFLKFLGTVAKDRPVVSNCRMAAMVVMNNVPVAVGYNKLKTHPLQAKFRKNEHAIYLHAEIDAIIKSLKTISADDLKKCTLYVSRIMSNGTLGMARPCPGCQAAIHEFQIKEVIWSTNDGYETSKNDIDFIDYKDQTLKY